MFLSRSFFENPRSLLIVSRTTSPSSLWIGNLFFLKCSSIFFDMVVFPLQGRPVNQITMPLFFWNFSILLELQFPFVGQVSYAEVLIARDYFEIFIFFFSAKIIINMTILGIAFKKSGRNKKVASVKIVVFED